MGAGQGGQGVSAPLAKGLAAAAAATPQDELKATFDKLSEADRAKFLSALQELATPRDAPPPAPDYSQAPEEKQQQNLNCGVGGQGMRVVEQLEAPIEVLQALQAAEEKQQQNLNCGVGGAGALVDEAPMKEEAPKAAAPAEEANVDPGGVLTPDQVASVRMAFKSGDGDSNKALDKGEMKSMLATVGCNLSDEELNTMMLALDTNQNGTIEFGEYLKMVSDSVKAAQAAA